MAAMLNSFCKWVPYYLHLKTFKAKFVSLRQISNLKNSIQFFGNGTKRITQTGDELDKLIGVRMRAMERKLRSVEKSKQQF